MTDFSRRMVLAGAGVAVLIPRLARAAEANMHQILKAASEHLATEVILTVGAPPAFRIKGEIIPLKSDPLVPVTCKNLISEVLTDAQGKALEKDGAIRMSFGVKGLS